MPKRKIDRTVPLSDKKRKRIVFCRQKKDLLKKCVELSKMCEQQVLLVVHDPVTQKMTYFQSHDEFNMAAAHQSKVVAKQPENIHQFEGFTNADYEDICQRDFRAVRYQREKIYSDPDMENPDEAEKQYFGSVTKKRTKKSEAKCPLHPKSSSVPKTRPKKESKSKSPLPCPCDKPKASDKPSDSVPSCKCASAESANLCTADPSGSEKPTPHAHLSSTAPHTSFSNEHHHTHHEHQHHHDLPPHDHHLCLPPSQIAAEKGDDMRACPLISQTDEDDPFCETCWQLRQEEIALLSKPDFLSLDI